MRESSYAAPRPNLYSNENGDGQALTGRYGDPVRRILGVAGADLVVVPDLENGSPGARLQRRAANLDWEFADVSKPSVETG